MILKSTHQISSNELKSVDFDIFIGASGYECRSTHSLKFLSIATIPKKIVFCFEDRINPQRDENDRIFTSSGVTPIFTNGDYENDVFNVVLESIDSFSKDSVRLFIDYSSMTRCWYSAIISAIRKITKKNNVECFFSYSPSIFEPPLQTTPNQTVGPIPEFGGLEANDRPTALVVGLGYEKDRAVGLLEYIDPAECFVFVTDPAIDVRFLETAKRNNISFLNLVGQDNQYLHSLSDLQRTSNLLLSLIWGLKDRYRVILAPLGVKPFSLMCLLLAFRYPEIDVWRVSSGIKAPTQLREAEGSLLVLNATFENLEQF